LRKGRLQWASSKDPIQSHCNIELVDRIDAVTVKLLGQHAYTDWKRTRMPLADEPVVQQGRVYALTIFRKRAEDARARAAAAAPAPGAGAGAGGPVGGAAAGAGVTLTDAEWARGERHAFEAADIQALVLDPDLLDAAAAMQRCAVDRGISIPSGSPAELVKRWLMQEKSAQALMAAGQNRVLQSVRTAAAPVAPTLPCAPAQSPMTQLDAVAAPPLMASVAAKQPLPLPQQLQLHPQAQPQPQHPAAGLARGGAGAAPKRRRTDQHKEKEAVKQKLRRQAAGLKQYTSVHSVAAEAVAAVVAAAAVAEAAVALAGFPST